MFKKLALVACVCTLNNVSAISLRELLVGADRNCVTGLVRSAVRKPAQLVEEYPLATLAALVVGAAAYRHSERVRNVTDGTVRWFGNVLAPKPTTP